MSALACRPRTSGESWAGNRATCSRYPAIVRALGALPCGRSITLKKIYFLHIVDRPRSKGFGASSFDFFFSSKRGPWLGTADQERPISSTSTRTDSSTTTTTAKERVPGVAGRRSGRTQSWAAAAVRRTTTGWTSIAAACRSRRWRGRRTAPRPACSTPSATKCPKRPTTAPLSWFPAS